jgi:hypothetical protein
MSSQCRERWFTTQQDRQLSALAITQPRSENYGRHEVTLEDLQLEAIESRLSVLMDINWRTPGTNSDAA